MALLRAASPSDLGPVIESDHVTLRTPQMSDYPAWAELRAQSREFLTPWEPLWASDELSRASFRRRVRHYLQLAHEDELSDIEIIGPTSQIDSTIPPYAAVLARYLIKASLPSGS